MCYGKIDLHLVEPSALPIGIMIKILQEFLKNFKKDYLLLPKRKSFKNSCRKKLMTTEFFKNYSQTKYMAMEFFNTSGKKSR